MSEINGLYPTPTRRALLRLIDAGGGRIYGEAKQVWDKQTYMRVTAKVREFIAHDWVRALAPDEPRGPGENASKRTYYRLTEYGRAALGGNH